MGRLWWRPRCGRCRRQPARLPLAAKIVQQQTQTHRRKHQARRFDCVQANAQHVHQPGLKIDKGLVVHVGVLLGAVADAPEQLGVHVAILHEPVGQLGSPGVIEVNCPVGQRAQQQSRQRHDSSIIDPAGENNCFHDYARRACLILGAARLPHEPGKIHFRPTSITIRWGLRNRELIFICRTPKKASSTMPLLILD